MAEKKVAHTLKYATQIGPGEVPAGEKVELWPDQVARIKAFEAQRQAAEADKSAKSNGEEG